MLDLTTSKFGAYRYWVEGTFAKRNVIGTGLVVCQCVLRLLGALKQGFQLSRFVRTGTDRGEGSMYTEEHSKAEKCD